ncbi:MAG: hypothetical protein ABI632_07220 [Pseudolysinimonas sp.]
MSKGNTAENDVLKALLGGVDPGYRANANRFLSLHTADPGEAGTQLTSETAYTGYARVAIATGAWTDGGSTFSNTNLLQFGQCTAAPGAAITHVAIGTVTTGGAGEILYSGALNASLAIAVLIQPQFAAFALTVSED